MKRSDIDTSFAAAAGRARYLIGRRLAAARAHSQIGEKAEAIGSLDDLTEALCSHLNDRRTAFVRAALGQTHAATEHVARFTPILGRDQYADLRNTIQSTKSALRSEHISGSDAGRLRHWEQTHAAAIGRQITMSLSNAQAALHAASEVVLNQQASAPPEPPVNGAAARRRIAAAPAVNSVGRLDPEGYRVRMAEFFAVSTFAQNEILDALVALIPSTEWPTVGIVHTLPIDSLIATRPTLRKAKLEHMATDPDVLGQRGGLPTVFRVGDQLLIEDGHHRLACLSASERATARVNVIGRGPEIR